MGTQYALIDDNSGYLWWTGTADSPEQACSHASLETGGLVARYERTHENTSAAGYHVYEIEGDWSDADGQSQAWIDRATAGRFVGRYDPQD